MARGEFWTEAESETLLLLWQEELSLSEIARRMRRSKNAISSRIGRLCEERGLDLRRPSPIKRDHAPAPPRRAGKSTLPPLGSLADV
jgi:hypothetical protein